ncbi:metal ABC transporter substrate-binding protein [Leucobacter denitrificans]|uniref:Zinc ABC transporter substrate-binding protein n=1 Tax=Leucobacter denitrificans TaxID=683042 RepID=A0A7G9S327_9MICO|nr:metal ABC transporter substrate-binding protein [Leucobacter denitrificans]QNN62252.1 zinc ABC transporter substrate-binding protein [Leucobacter denitrificans]
MTHTSRARRHVALPITGALAGALAGALLLSGCGSTPAEAPTDALNVVATTTQLTDFATQVGGDDISLTGLLSVGASAHHFDPSPKELLALSQADVLIVNGAGLETFIDSAIEASGFDGAIITAADGVDLEAHEEEEHEHQHEDEAPDQDADHDEADHAHEESDHADHADHDHDHGGVNPHIWTSPRNAIGMVDEIEHGFVAADPENEAAYTQRASEYRATLTALDEWISTQFEQIPEADRVLVSGHDSLHYYLEDYGIEFAGSIIPSFEDNAEPSAAEIDALVATIQERGVKAIFVESSMSPKLARTIAKEAGVTVVDSESLFADSLGAEGTGAETYVAATIHNTRVIVEAWGATPTELPAELGGAE